MIRDLPPGRALDVGISQGRNAIFLAQHGWKVTGFRSAPFWQALALKLIVQGSEAFDGGESRWDLVVEMVVC
jgi:hypothetical protein